jgi:hypothetical protein
VLLLVALGVVAVAIALWLPPIRQDPAYHAFADRRTLLGVPNALGHLVSGHTLKHLASALAAYWILRMLRFVLTGPPDTF